MKTDVKSKCAEQVMDAVPMAIRTIGAEMRRRHSEKLSAQQFRAMSFIRFNRGASLSSVADFVGVRLPTTSKLVDGLVDKKYVIRKTDGADRRRVVLNLSARGEEILDYMRRDAIGFVENILQPLSEKECAMMMLSMELLYTMMKSSHADSTKDKKA
jgi:DNA-binding MarR family transcriptional regulator